MAPLRSAFCMHNSVIYLTYDYEYNFIFDIPFPVWSRYNSRSSRKIRNRRKTDHIPKHCGSIFSEHFTSCLFRLLNLPDIFQLEIIANPSDCRIHHRRMDNCPDYRKNDILVGQSHSRQSGKTK